MLAALLNTPTNDVTTWNVYAFNLQNEVNLCNDAILTQFDIDNPSYQIDPVPLFALQQWTQNISFSLTAIAEALGQQSVDLLDVDLSDTNQRTDWVYNIWQQLSSAEATLQI